jgi:protein-S-isoprenylcysteine O-methyltransferase Ste14
MRATEFEFRIRFIIIMAFFTVGFWCYGLDRVNVSVMLTERLMGHPMRSAADLHVLQAVLGLGALLAVLAALIRTWAAAYLQSGVVHDTNLHGEELVADGPYRYVRNPLYLGGMLFAIGFAMAASRLGFVVVVAGLTVFYYRLIAREESLLSETQGGSYRQYLQAVPRLLPSLAPRVAPSGLVPRWGQAAVGEAFMWFFATASVCFAATLNRRLFLIMIVGGVAASLLAKVVVWRGRQPQTP